MNIDFVADYQNKFESGSQKLQDILNSFSWMDVRSANMGDRMRIVVRPRANSKCDYSVAIELDANDNNKSCFHGIFFGVRKEKGEMHDAEIEDLWKLYKLMFFSNENVNRGDIFKTTGLDKSSDGKKWKFWVHLNDKQQLEDAAGAIIVLIMGLKIIGKW